MRMKDMLLKKNEETILLYNAFVFFMENPENKYLEELNPLGDYYLLMEESETKKEIKCSILYLIKKDFRRAKLHLKKAEILSPDQKVISFSRALLKMNSGVVHQYINIISTFKGRLALVSLIAAIMIGYEIMGVEQLNKPFGFGVLAILIILTVVIYIRRKNFEYKKIHMEKVE